jgi:outer membrane receptor for ferrienterochelin and colicin
MSLKRGRAAGWLAILTAPVVGAPWAEASAEEPVVEYRMEDIEVSDTAIDAEKSADLAVTAPVTVLDEKAIDETAARNAGDVLQRLPGVFLDGSALQRGQNQSASIRGMDTAYTLVLIDGQRVAKDSLDGGYDLSRIPAEAIERIEVVKGPQAVMLGGDAIGGVINIVTRRTVKQTTASIEAGYGTFETRAFGASAASRLGGLGVSARFRQEASAGWSDAWDRDLDLQRNYPKDGSRPTERTFAEVGFDGQPLAGLTLRGTAQVIRSDRAIDTYTERLEDSGASFGSRNGLDVDLRGTASYGDGTESAWQVDLSWFRHRTAMRTETDAIDWNSGEIVSYTTEADAQDVIHHLGGLQVRHRHLLGNRHFLTALVEARGEWRDSDNQSDQEIRDAEGLLVSRATYKEAFRVYSLREIFYGLAVMDEIFLTDAWSVTPGLRLDGSDYWGVVLLPSVSTLYEATAWLQLRYAVGAGYRRPTFESRTLPPFPVLELSGDRYVVGNPDLSPEWSIGQELAATIYIGRPAPSRAGGLGGLTRPAPSAEATVALFRNDFWNKIEEQQAGYYDDGLSDLMVQDVPEVPVFSESNIERARTQGIEADLSVTPVERWTLGGNVTLTDGENLSGARPLQGVPPVVANGFTSVRAPWSETTVTVAVIYASEWERLTALGFPVREGPTPAKLRFDGTVTQPLGKYLSARVVFENLGNQGWDRDNDGDSDTPPRSWFATLGATYY